MQINALTISLAAAMLAGCAGQFARPSTPASAETQEKLIGIWAMIPLRNGIANAVEYGADAKATLHPFNCVEPGKHEPTELSDFKVSEDGKLIHLKSPNNATDLKILALGPQTMKLGMDAPDENLTFSYVRVSEVQSLCALYPGAATEIARRTPFHTTDFVQNPKVPAHSGMQRYIGKWKNDQGELEVEVVMDASGNAYLYMAPSKNWNMLYNDVNWVGDELHFQSFAYSDLPSLYSHPFHKQKTQSVLQPNTDGKLRYSFFIEGRRYEFMLSRD
jgi:hypothetical protein